MTRPMPGLSRNALRPRQVVGLALLHSLLFALLYHSMNGLRIVLVDFFPGVIKREKMLTGLVVFVTLAAGIPGSLVILWPFIDGKIL